jgi:predicted dehydrogenase
MSPATLTNAPKMRTLKVLHVGVTNRGKWPLEKCDASTGFARHALCDVSDAALAEARQVTGLSEAACFRDLDRAIAESGADVMICCAPTMLHVPITKKAIAAKMPMLVEKGMAPTWADAQELVRATLGANAIVCVAQNYRYNTIERTIRAAIQDPSHPAHVGEVHLVQYAQNRVRPIVRTLSYPFASVWDMSCHHFDTLADWLGPIASIDAHAWAASWSAYEHDNNTDGHFTFANARAICHYLHTHDAARATTEIQVHGARGALVFDGATLTFNERPLEQFGTRPIVDVPLVEAHGERDVLRDFHAYVTQGAEPGISARNNLETMAACEMMVRSITLGRTVRRSELDA